ncbi:PTS sugar transporter subunit IIA [Facklamia sp. DSM 111018]|uniref:PTS sugar transporter subunit IIA n=1 Tax=Facklamia lactis TaxID=2749967 RepID=A0ABS0LT28_9LACT|nr:PTS sugar transporter subunit IIA [Facklamia lactis]MBG9987318.1 PTS sugar transporter subunit IIA [Facklamia lactis]
MSIVFLLAIKEKDSGFMKLFFDWLSLMIDQPEKMSKLKEAHHRDEFIEVILNQ